MSTPKCLTWTSIALLGLVSLTPWMGMGRSVEDDTCAGAPAESSSNTVSQGSSGSETSAEADAAPDTARSSEESPGDDDGASAPEEQDLLKITKVGPEEKPDRYVIQPGDTLWDISGRFWGDPFFWPKLWSYNPYIGNAHLIYPGNVLRFFAGNYVRPPSMEIDGRGDGAGVASNDGVKEQTVRPTAMSTRGDKCESPIPFLDYSGPISVRNTGFLREEAFNAIGSVTKAPEAKGYLGQRDLIYLKFNRLSDVQCGDKFTVYRATADRFRHPIERKRRMGTAYQILAEAQIIDINDYVATARIRQSYSEINRGDLIAPLIPVNFRIQPQATSKELEGFVIHAPGTEEHLLGQKDIVYIDRGQRDGVGVGDSFYIVRQKDGLDGLLAPDAIDVTLPYQVVGKVVVVAPRENSSEAVVTEASDSIEIGDRVRTQIN